MNAIDPIFESFLQRQVELAADLEQANPDLFSIVPIPMEGYLAPSIYRVAVSCKSLRCEPGGQVREVDGDVVFGIRFSPSYCRRIDGPVCRFLTKHVFHPNVSPASGGVCLHIRPSTPITELIMAVYELIAWRRMATGDSLNQAAAQWARSLPDGRFPLEIRTVRIPERKLS